VIRNAVTNLLLRREEFDNAYWSLQNVTGFGSKGTADSIAAPDGSNTADEINTGASGGTADGVVNSSVSGITNNQVMTGSVFVKMGTAVGGIRLRSRFIGGSTEDGNVYFDLSTGTKTSQSGNRTGTITDVGNGWYRLSITGTNNATGNVSYQLFVYGNNITAGSYYLWGAQAEKASDVGPYVKTTSTINSAPRFDHNPTTGESLGLLVEESRTNLATDSEDFDSSTYTKDNVSVNVNSITSPDGTTNADYIQENTQNQRHRVYDSGLSATAGTVYTISVYAKSSTRNCMINANSIFGARSSFSLTGDGSILQTDSGSATITNVGNGWYRCSVTGTAPNTTTGAVFFQAQDGSSDVPYVGDGTSGIYFWGAQVEVGSFPTSYIRTAGSTVTRSADVTRVVGGGK
jgi:hypothetical protein